jgi:hypothetical protein
MKHPDEHANDALYWAWLLCGVARSAIRELRAGQPNVARQQLEIAERDFSNSSLGDQT